MPNDMACVDFGCLLRRAQDLGYAPRVDCDNRQTYVYDTASYPFKGSPNA